MLRGFAVDLHESFICLHGADLVISKGRTLGQGIINMARKSGGKHLCLQFPWSIAVRLL